MSNGAGKFNPFPKYVLSNFVTRNKVLLKAVCFVTVHWYQSWGGAECMVPPTPSVGSYAPPRSPGSAAYGSVLTDAVDVVGENATLKQNEHRVRTII